MFMRKKSKMCVIGAILLVLAGVTACSSKPSESATAAPKETAPAKETAAPAPTGSGSEKKELVVFAAASMTESMKAIAKLYEEENPNVKIVYNFDSSGTLKTQIQEGAPVDIFISAGQKQMNDLDIKANPDTNKEGLDFVAEGTRFNLVTNKVVLIVPDTSKAEISSFEDVATDKVKKVALGNGDVPVGQYSKEIFTHLKLWDALEKEGKITFASNVKEVLAQTQEAAVDCGVVYVSDAATAKGVKVVAEAPEGSHKPVYYPAAILKESKNMEESKAFMEFLKSLKSQAVFTGIGFGIPENK